MTVIAKMQAALEGIIEDEVAKRVEEATEYHKKQLDELEVRLTKTEERPVNPVGMEELEFICAVQAVQIDNHKDQVLKLERQLASENRLLKEKDEVISRLNYKTYNDANLIIEQTDYMNKKDLDVDRLKIDLNAKSQKILDYEALISARDATIAHHNQIIVEQRNQLAALKNPDMLPSPVKEHGNGTEETDRRVPRR